MLLEVGSGKTKYIYEYLSKLLLPSTFRDDHFVRQLFELAPEFSVFEDDAKFPLVPAFPVPGDSLAPINCLEEFTDIGGVGSHLGHGWRRWQMSASSLALLRE